MNLLLNQKKIYWLLLAISVIMFGWFLFGNATHLYYDEVAYQSVSKQILHKGLFAVDEPLRTYLYPLLISTVTLVSGGSIVWLKIMVGILQYFLYIYTVYKLAHYTRGFTQTEIGYATVLFVGLLNPYLIQSTTMVLTDLTALCLIVLVVCKVVFGEITRFKDYFLIFGGLCASAMIRPSSLIFCMLIVIILFMRKFMLKEALSYGKAIGAGSIGLLLFYPQLYNNVVLHNHWTPLVHQDLYDFQSRLAATYLKYSTVVIYGENPRMIYHTPFQVNADSNIFDLILQQPLAFLLAYFSHLFGALDWGYIEIYVKHLYPVSRIIASIFLYSFWLVAFYGWWKTIKEKAMYVQRKFIVVSLSILFWGYLLFLGTTVIESRFGYPLLFFFAPFAAIGVHLIYGQLVKKDTLQLNAGKLIKLLAIVIPIFLVLFFLSFLLDYQTGRINWLGF